MCDLAHASARPVQKQYMRPVTREEACLANLARSLAASWADLPPQVILAPARASRRVSRARHLAFYLAHVTYGLSQNEVARRFARHRASVAYGCARIEEARERPAFDALVDTLEARARSAIADRVQA